MKKNLKTAAEPKCSISPTGERFPLPAPADYAREYARLEKLAARQRREGKEIVGVVGLGFVGAVMAAIVDGEIVAWGDGSQDTVVPTSQGNRKLYSQESPEVWFEDFGEGQLMAGMAHVELDPLFLETVTIDQAHPMKVFIQLNEECHGVYVNRQTTGFKVKELRGGTSCAHFTYRVVAKRKGFETARLEAAGDTTKVAVLKTPNK